MGPAQVGLLLQHLLHAVERGELPEGNVLQEDQDQHVLAFVKQAKAGNEVVIALSLIDLSSADVHVISTNDK